MTFYSAGSEALIQVWRDETLTVERLLAVSDWLLHQFLFDVAGAVEVWNQGNPPSVAIETAGISDANLIFRAVALAGRKPPAKEDKASRQKLFVRWLMSRLEPDASRLAQLGGHLRDALLEPLRAAKSHEERVIAALTCGELYLAFPEELQRAVHLRKADLNALKLDQWQPMALGEYSFDLRDFFRAAERALRRGEAALTARVPDNLKFSVRPEQNSERLVIVLESKEAKKRMRISDACLGLLQSDAATREAGMFAQRHWLDLSKADADRTFPKIARIKNLHERMRQYYELREKSLALHFSSLATRFSQRDNVQTGDLRPPSPETILRHIRVPPRPSDGELRAHLDQSAEILIEDEGFEEAFIRIGALPVALPAAFKTAFAKMESESREKWVRRALEELKTPIMQLHLASILLDGNDDEVRSAVDVLCGFASDEGAERFDAFEAVLTWTYREIIATADLDLPEAAILAAAWSYAARLHQLLSIYTEQAEIVRSFEDGAKPRPRELLRRRHKIWVDVAGPQMVSQETLAVHGIAAVLEGRSVAQELREKIGGALRKLCFPFAESPTLPALPLLRIRATQRDTLGSFLGECRTETLASFIGDEAARFSDAQILADVEHVIRGIAEQPNDPGAWSNAVPFLGMHPPPAELSEVFRRCLLTTDWTQFAEVAETTREGILLFLTSQAANFPDDEIYNHFRLQLIALARQFAATLKDHTVIEHAALLLANCAHFLAINRGDELAAAGALLSIIGEICQAWPRAARHIWRLNAPLLLRQPAATVPKLWPLIFRLRATSERLES